MRNRSIVGMILLTLVTLGIYPIYWYVSTKNEMVEQGAEIPTALLLIVPFANIYWMWKWSVGVEHVTRGKTSAAVSMLLMMLLGFIGMAIIQSSFNNLALQARNDLPQARVV